ncbi:protein kinase domain-containing protein [Saccharothrix variisporea]|uniref:protein kinase domain-containing protein n=1 Tax=Saccharothrix variisporea TaxID=543527 RepID=UPI001B87072B|nr:protein kinase [Saccharothrix variisporea]
MRSGDVVAGRYRLEEVVGRGGMGEVWRAADLELRRVVALKQATTGDGDGVRREARIGAGLHHPHVISVFDVVVENGVRWLVMEHLPARSLAEVVRTDGPLSPRVAASVGAQVADALSAMHAKGMVHRDITLANVLVTADGTAKLADLGVAVWSEVTLTGTARLAGTPGYLAPEVLRGHPATAASDMFALGTTLSAAVEGNAEGTGPLAVVLSALVDPDPRRRPTAAEVRWQLSRFAGGTGEPTPVGGTVPRQLPAPTHDFVGREAELALLAALVDEPAANGGPVVITTVAGGGGVGKTALAVHWAHRVADRFPDGQLYLDLRGFAPSGAPMVPGEAVRTLLDSFRVPTERIPSGLDAQAALYRSLLAGRRMLVLLDNARDADQVRPLLPGTAGCLVVVTSRNQLTGLVTGHAARHVPIDVLPEPEARALLVARLGADRVAAEPRAVDELLAHCGGLPLALSIVAGRVQTDPHLPLSTVAAELREERLSALDDDDPAVSLPTVLSWSYDALTPDQTRVLGLLAVAPGPDIALPAAVNLVGLPVARTRAVLRGLRRMSLVDQDIAGRYRMHDLVRQYAVDRAERDLPRADREAALRRLVGYYLHTAHTAEQLIPPPRPPIDLGLPAPAHRRPLADEAEALAWFAAEHACLLAAQRLAAAQGWHEAVWQAAWTLSRFHQRKAHHHDDLAVWEAAVRAAAHLDGPAVHAAVHRRLGHALVWTGRVEESFDHLHQALTWAERAGDRHEQAHAHQTLAVHWAQRGEDERALTHSAAALDLFRALGEPVWEAVALNGAGFLHARLGDFEKAREYCEASLRLSARHANREGEAEALDSLGYIAHQTGDHLRAVDHYRRALDILRDLGDNHMHAYALRALGHPLTALGRHDEARAVWRQALALFEGLPRASDVEEVRRLLGLD